MSDTTPVAPNSQLIYAYPPAQMADDEIDLFELVANIWQQKGMIIGITVLMAAMAFGYLSWVTPKFEAGVVIRPSEIVDLRQLKQSIVRYTASLEYQKNSSNAAALSYENNVFDRYITLAGSQEVMRRFFSSEILPVYQSRHGGVSKAQLYADFTNSITLVKPNYKKNNSDLKIQFTDQDATWAATVLNDYVELLGKALSAELVNEEELFVKGLLDQLTQEMQEMHKIALIETQDKILRLDEALNLTLAIGMKNPSLDKANFGSSLHLTDDFDSLYLRGSEILAKQKSMLERRKDLSPYIPGLRQLQSQIAQLQNHQIDLSQLKVARIDASPQPPEKPKSPKKTLIMALGILLGGMIGVFTVFIRMAVRNHKSKLAGV